MLCEACMMGMYACCDVANTVMACLCSRLLVVAHAPPFERSTSPRASGVTLPLFPADLELRGSFRRFPLRSVATSPLLAAGLTCHASVPKAPTPN